MLRQIVVVGAISGLLLAWYGAARAGLLDNVPEAADYTLVYRLDIPSVSNFRDAKAPTYSVNSAASTKLYDRVAYYLELDTGSGPQWVYASMDAFHLNASQIALPHNVLNAVTRQQTVSNMNVYSNVGGIVTGTGISTGSIEMWPSNYGGNTTAYVPTGSSAFDWNDSGFNTTAGHSSFQVHNYDLDGPGGAGTAGQTILAYNRWGHSDANPAAIGIGNRPASDLDWTFATNAGTYVVKDLQVLVREVSPIRRPLLPDLPQAPAAILANVPEASSYGLVYQLPIGTGAFSPSQYVVDNSDAISDGSFGRIAYYLELQSPNYGQEYVWVSMDAFNLDAELIGVPNTAAHIQQMVVNNLNVVASAGSGVTSGEGLSGNIEFWNTNYGGTATNLIPGGAATLDFDDYRSLTGNYGSMQVHNFLAGETIFAFNHWMTGVPDLGIGNDPRTTRGNHNPDWTFAYQTAGAAADQYTVRNLYVFVQQVHIPEPSTFVLAALGTLGLGFVGWRKREQR